MSDQIKSDQVQPLAAHSARRLRVSFAGTADHVAERVCCCALQEVAMKVEQGVRELVKAETTQKNGRAMLCIIALIVMIVVMLIIVVLRKTI
jgi:hypothetical protein